MANALYPKWKEALVTGAANAALNGSGTTGSRMPENVESKYE